MSKNTDLSRALSHALRHEPWLYELELDAEGWATVESVFSALRSERPAWADLTDQDLIKAIASGDKHRHEMRDGKVRAMYGHSIPGRLQRTPSRPPEILYHATNPETVAAIQATGLQRMARQFVHLSADLETSWAVGKRKAKAPTMLYIQAQRAYEEGVPFYMGNDKVWLADHVPPEFIDFEETK